MKPTFPTIHWYCQKWRWAINGVQWCPSFGVMGSASVTYIEQLIYELVALDPYAPR